MLVMRETTERPQGVEAGLCLIGTQKARIMAETTKLS